MNPSTKLRNPQQKPNGESTLRNSQQLGATQHVLDPYTVYVSGNYVVKFYDEYAGCPSAPLRGRLNAGGQRIASKLWQWQYNPTANPSQDPITPVHPPAVQNNIMLEDLMDVLNLWDGDLGGVVPTLQELQHMQLPTRAPYQTELCAHYNEEVYPDIFPHGLTDSMSTLDHINCLCRNGQTAYVWQNYGVSCHNFEELYFYHPDYLSNTEYVTDAGGYVYQYLFYSPFGESLYSQHAQTGEYNTPHRFNAKELDAETGNYYYGARYFNPRVSVWLSVDPLASERNWLTPYNFVQNNPIIRIDPDGMLDITPDEPKVNADIEACTQPMPPPLPSASNAPTSNTPDVSSIPQNIGYSPVLWPNTRGNQSSEFGSSDMTNFRNSNNALTIGSGILGALEGLSVSQGFWLGENGKYYKGYTGRGPNRFTGSRSGAFKAASSYRLAIKATVGLSLTIGAISTIEGYQVDGGRFGYNAQHAAFSTIGSVGFGWAGVKLGAATGALFGAPFAGVGAVPGSVIGGVLGGLGFGIGAGYFGSYLGGSAVDFYHGR